jgi:glyoxylase-like metal-dependent hydrolase (beta-lactamase superfamily II)
MFQIPAAQFFGFTEQMRYTMKSLSRIYLFISAALIALAGASATFAAEPKVGAFTSSVKTFFTASYWLEGPEGLLMIDTQFLPKEGLQAVAQAERETGKKVTAAIVLHPNPDKFNGTEAFQARGIRVLTSDAVIAAIPGVHVIRTGWFAEEYKPDYPAKAAKPASFGNATLSQTFAGVPVTLHALGPGCSAAHVVVQAGDAVFVGDLVNPDNHAWLELGTIDAWLARLEEIRKMKPTRVFPGRGKPGGVELIDNQAAYLRFVQKTVRDAEPSGALGFIRKLRLQSAIEGAYPKLGYNLFMRDGLEKVWEIEARKGGK